MKRVTSPLLSKFCTCTLHGFGLAGTNLTDHLKTFGMPHAKFFQTNQMHGDKIVLLPTTDDRRPTTILEADSFITNDTGIVCYVRTADCVPILLCDPVKNAIAAIHAGWRGTAKKIAAKTVDRMMQEFACKAENIFAAIGPAIGGECYEVGQAVADAIYPLLCKEGEGEVESSTPSDSPFRHTIGGQVQKGRINLPSINRAILLGSGLPAQNIDLIPICSHCDSRFASYRRDKSEERRQVNFIVIV